MAKYGELWNDSALVKALDDAISKYKIMHGKRDAISSVGEERITKCTEDSEMIFFNESNEAKSACVETDVITTDKPNGDQVQDTDCTYVDPQTAVDYNVLLNQYNAVEEQRQKLLGQLYQYGNWDYESYGYGAAAGYDSQYQPQQPSVPPVCSCRPYVCPCSTAPCSSMPAASCGEDGDVIKAAMGAIDRVIESFNAEDKEGKKADEVETGLGNVVQEKASQTDLSVVLNALVFCRPLHWQVSHRAGFYEEMNQLVSRWNIAIDSGKHII